MACEESLPHKTVSILKSYLKLLNLATLAMFRGSLRFFFSFSFLLTPHLPYSFSLPTSNTKLNIFFFLLRRKLTSYFWFGTLGGGC